MSADKHTLTFQMSADAGLNQAIVMVNGDSTNASGQPYLAVINDPLEDPAQHPNTTSASDGSGVNLQTGVLNFQQFATKYLADHPNSGAQTAPAATTSSMAGKTVDGTAIPAGQKTSAGNLVSASSTNVRYPNVRAMAANDLTFALKAAVDTIKANPTALNTLYFPNGTYVWSGLLVNGVDGSTLKGGKLKIYTDEGALLQNRIQAYMEAFEPHGRDHQLQQHRNRRPWHVRRQRRGELPRRLARRLPQRAPGRRHGHVLVGHHVQRHLRA